jgi:Cu+-exporting ATPase
MSAFKAVAPARRFAHAPGSRRHPHYTETGMPHAGATRLERNAGGADGEITGTKGGTPMATVTDPVCGMQIDSTQAAGQAMHNGKAYYFCAEECRAKFVEHPEKYIDQQEPDNAPIPLP